MGRSLSIGTLLLLLASSCAGPKPEALRPRAPLVQILIACSVPDTRLYLDGQLIRERCGPEARAGVTTRPGAHRVEARHEGHFAELLDVDLEKPVSSLEIVMRPVPSLVRTELEADSPP